MSEPSGAKRGFVDWDEWYPVYEITWGEPRESRYRKFVAHEFTPEFIERYERIWAEFQELQEELRRLSGDDDA